MSGRRSASGLNAAAENGRARRNAPAGDSEGKRKPLSRRAIGLAVGSGAAAGGVRRRE